MRIRRWCDRPGNGWKRAGAGGSTSWTGDDRALRPLLYVPETEMKVVEAEATVSRIDAGMQLEMLVTMTPAAGGGAGPGIEAETVCRCFEAPCSILTCMAAELDNKVSCQ